MSNPDKKIATVMTEIINFLNPICKHRYPIKGFYREKKDYGPPIMLFYYQDSSYNYLVNVEPLYVINLATMRPTSSSYIQTELPSALNTLITDTFYR